MIEEFDGSFHINMFLIERECVYIKEPLFFQFNEFLDSRAEIHQIFAMFFFGKFKTSKSHSEIN